MDQAKLVANIENITGIHFRQSSPEDISQFKKFGAPKEVLDFFTYYEPCNCAEISGVRLWPITELIRENRDFIPGADLHPRGFLVIATNEHGDSFCVDLTVPKDQYRPIVIMSHELSWEDMLDNEVQALRKIVAESFIEFLKLFAACRLDKEPLFEQQIG